MVYLDDVVFPGSIGVRRPIKGRADYERDLICRILVQTQGQQLVQDLKEACRRGSALLERRQIQCARFGGSLAGRYGQVCWSPLARNLHEREVMMLLLDLVDDRGMALVNEWMGKNSSWLEQRFGGRQGGQDVLLANAQATAGLWLMPGELEFVFQEGAVWVLSVSVKAQRLMMGPGGLFEGVAATDLKARVLDERGIVLAEGLGIAGYELQWYSLKNEPVEELQVTDNCEPEQSFWDKFIPKVPQCWISASRGGDGSIQPIVLVRGSNSSLGEMPSLIADERQRQGTPPVYRYIGQHRWLAAAWLVWTNVTRLEQNQGVLGSGGSRVSAAAREAVEAVVLQNCGRWLDRECNVWDAPGTNVEAGAAGELQCTFESLFEALSGQ